MAQGDAAGKGEGDLASFGFGTPWEEQLAFFRRKLNLPTERWDDIKRAAHDRAFIVAGAAKADLLQDLRDAVDRSIATADLASFRRDFKQIVAKNGWTGWTGEGSAKGEAWRTRVIFQTNQASSYAAGRWQQMNSPEEASERPFWRYEHADGVLHPRPHHLAWHGTTLPREHPFWKTHFAPNGWGCRCEIFPVKAPAAGDTTTPPEGWDSIDPKTGAPPGIDRGWDYAPGANAAAPLVELVKRKLFDLDAPLGAAMAAELMPAIAMEQRLAWTSMVDRVAATLKPVGDTELAATLTPQTVQQLQQAGVTVDNAAVWLRDHELAHALRDIKAQRGGAMPQEVWRELPALMRGATLYLDTVDQALVYALDLPSGTGKVVVRVNFNVKGQFGGVRERITSNFITTGGVVDSDNIAKDKRYVLMRV